MDVQALQNIFLYLCNNKIINYLFFYTIATVAAYIEYYRIKLNAIYFIRDTNFYKNNNIKYHK